MTPDTARGRLVPVAATLAALALATLGTLCAPFDTVLREDALSYLDQAFALRAGDWTATAHPVGWPLLLAGAMELLGVRARGDAMQLARLLSVLLVAACAFPVASLARRAAGERAALLAVLALACSTTLIWLGGIAYADPLFVLLATWSAAWAARSQGRLRPLLGATALASLSFWVKPSGLFLLLALLVYAAIVRRRAGLRLAPLLWLPLLFVALSLPHLVLRARTFGSPFSYGENSKYFVDSYAQVWDPSVPIPSLGNYLASHTPAQWLDKFVVHGALRIGWYFLLEIGALWALLLAAGIWLWARRGLDVLLCLLVPAALLLGLVPVFAVFGDPRYMAMTLPFVFVIGSAAFARLAEASPWPRALTAVFALALAAQVPLAFARGELAVRTNPLAPRTPRVRDAWAAWTVRHVSPPVALVEGGDLLQLACDEARAAGELPPETAALPDFPYRRPGLAPDLGAALDQLERLGIHTLLVDSRNAGRLPWLSELHGARWAGRLELLQSFRAAPDERWALSDMEVYRIIPAKP
ncbi:MAG TPA: glycosyltransferase family 39 protein [Planctomycetota bacterium]|nr:glycosyltransferase family 39 protein [Planctomycetota bacterium]